MNTKEYKSTQKFLMGSPRKLRQVVAVIKKLKPIDSVSKLPFVQRKAAGDLLKVVKSAIANARVQGANEAELVFKEIQITQGPRLKRGQAASRGRWHQFKRKMSHIRVVLTTAKKEEIKVKNKTVKVEKKEIKTEKISKKGVTSR